MRKLFVFNNVTLDGYFTDADGDMSWAHKNDPGEDMVILGSGSIVSQLSEHGLIDEYQIVVNPIVLGKGRTMFDGLRKRLPMKRTKTRTFENGNVLLCYEPVT